MHRFLVVGVAALAALALSAPAGAWTWPADGAVLRPFALGSDPYAGGQHRGVDVAGPEGSRDPRTRRGNRDVRRVAPDARPRRDDPDGGRLCRHARPPRHDRRREGRVRRRRLVDRDDGVERDARACRAERPPRHPARERRRRVRRPARAPSAPSGSRACADRGAGPGTDAGPCPRTQPLRRPRPAHRRTHNRTRPVRRRHLHLPLRRRPRPPRRGSLLPTRRHPLRPDVPTAGSSPATSPDPVRGSSNGARSRAPREGSRGSRSPRRAFRTDGRLRRPTRDRAGPTSPVPVPPCPAIPPPRPPPADEPVPAGAANRGGDRRGRRRLGLRQRVARRERLSRADGIRASDGVRGHSVRSTRPRRTGPGAVGRASWEPRGGDRGRRSDTRDPRRRRARRPARGGVPPRVPRRSGRGPESRP